jgi:hypothetical protein
MKNKQLNFFYGNEMVSVAVDENSDQLVVCGYRRVGKTKAAKNVFKALAIHGLNPRFWHKIFH